MRAAGVSQHALAVALGIRDATISDWFNKDWMPDADILMKMPAALHVDGHWLLTGDGDMQRPEPTIATAALSQIFAVVDRARELGLNTTIEAAAGPSDVDLSKLDVAAAKTDIDAREESAGKQKAPGKRAGGGRSA